MASPISQEFPTEDVVPKKYIRDISDYLRYHMIVHTFFKKVLIIPLYTVSVAEPVLPMTGLFDVLLKSLVEDRVANGETPGYQRRELPVFALGKSRYTISSSLRGFPIPEPVKLRSSLIVAHPILHSLSFRNYRLAGGSIVSCITENRKTSHDLDFFPIVDVPQSIGPFERERYIADQADIIYATFMADVQTYSEYISTKTKGAGCCFITRSSDCTTIIFEMESHTEILQFIHRAYTSEGELLAGFDLAPSQILFDGDGFRMTHFAHMSILTGVIPVDISCASKSWKYRLNKYNQEKQFTLWFPGLSYAGVEKCLERKDPQPIARINAEHKPVLADGNVGGNKTGYAKMKGTGHTRIDFESVGFEIHRRNIRGPNFFQYRIPRWDEEKFDAISIKHQFVHADYGDVLEEVEDAESLATSNLRCLWNGQAISVGCSNFKQFAAKEFTVHSIGNAFRSAAACPANFTVAKFERIFNYDGCTAPWSQDALDAVRNQNAEKYERIVAATIEYLDAKIQKESAKLRQGVHWRVRDPGTQISGTFNPLKFTPSTFYPTVMIDGKLTHLYNGFNLGINWEIKRLFLIAYKKRDYECILSGIPMDVIKLLFQWLDWMTIKEIIVELNDYEFEAMDFGMKKAQSEAIGAGSLLGMLAKSMGN